MSDRRNTPPRSVPSTIDAHRVVAPRTARPAATPVAPAVHAPARRPSASDADAARLLRTVDALRRLQSTLAAAQQALDTVIVEVSGAVERETAGLAAPSRAGRAPTTPPPARRPLAVPPRGPAAPGGPAAR